MLMYIFKMIGIASGYLVFAGLIRRYGSHTLINGFMSPDQADAVFPNWRKRQSPADESKKGKNN